MATFRNASFEKIVAQSLKKTAAVLRDAEVPFCLIGSLSAWVRGGPESSHDLDFGIKEKDVMKACMALEAAGFSIVVPDEDWLVKAWDGEPDHEDSTLIDLIYAPSGVEINDEVLERADWMDVLAQPMKILNPSDLMIMKLLSIREQHLNYTSTIATARAIREQIDWKRVRTETEESPYARAFFVMAEGLNICASEQTHPDVVDVLASMQTKQRPHREMFKARIELIEYLLNKDKNNLLT